MLKIYDTLTRDKREFKAQNPVKMYVCGVTVYDYCHIGHALSYIFFDVVRRYLEYRGYQVKYIQNFTDVDDKIIAASKKMGISPQELTESLIQGFFADMDALNIKRADVYPRVTEEIPTIINVIEGLISKGHAYPAKGNVYFRVSSFSNYGKLSGRNLEEMMTGNQGQFEEQKESALDFALWKAAKPGEPEWESPWGKGRPGWHIECTAMALKYLGLSIDIHGGGQDLIFPHHENEIAQSEAYTGQKPFVRYWMHNGLLQLGQEKMSKSLGNYITIKEALSKFSSDAFRLFVLNSHYRSHITFSEEGVAAVGKGLERLRNAAFSDKNTNHAGDNILKGDPYKERFIEAMDDDFNTAQAVAVLFDLARDINRGQEANSQVNEAKSTLIDLAGVLGLTMEKQEGKISLDAMPFIELLVSTRNQLRDAKQWQLADNIRESLDKLGVVLEDKPQGTTWKHSKAS
ncbi:MAG: cysteine--tRNA ligase [Chloroflexi bacterium]|nr:cysteine--tRNA ligase [Chloroflexota bacterium]